MKNKEPNLNRDREFVVILEGLRSDFRVLSKELFALIEKVDLLSNKVDGIFKRITLLEQTVFNK